MNSDHSKILNETFEIIADHIEVNYNNNSKVIDYKSPKELKEILDLKISETGISENDLLKEIKTYLKYSVKTGNKQFFNQLYSGFTIPGFLGEVITALTNTSMYTYEVAPVATLIEKELINKMCNIVGFKNGTGLFVTGGSNANFIAMFSARNRFYPEAKTQGMVNTKSLTAFVSDQAHYSLGTAANILGIGSDNLIKVRSDKTGKMIPEELEKAIIQSLQRNEQPFFIAATAGTTLFGAFDPIDDIKIIADKFACWLHVDGSFGGSIILSKNKKYLFKGIENVDSFSWNAHKLMNVPLVASVILINEANTLRSNLTKLNTDYIFHENEDQSCDLGEISVQCGRKVDALKVWLAWKFYGDAGYEQRIDHMIEIADYFASIVKKRKDLELMSDVQSLTVCFRYNPGDISDLNNYNLLIREMLRKAGKTIVNYGYIKEDLTIRFVVSNAEVEKKDIDQFFNYFFEVADAINENEPLTNAKRFDNNIGLAPNSR